MPNYPTPDRTPWYLQFDSLSYEGYSDPQDIPSNLTTSTVVETGSGGGVNQDHVAFVGAFQVLDNLYGLFGTRLTQTSYAGPLFRLMRGGDLVQRDFFTFDDTGWADKDEIATWLGAATGYVYRLYDQTGNLRDAWQTNAPTNAPTIDLTGDHPAVLFNPATTTHLGCAAAADFGQNSGGHTMVAVIKPSVLLNCVPMSCFFLAGGSIRAALTANGTLFQAKGRRLDGDTLVATVGLTQTTNWVIEIARFEISAAKLHHSIDAVSETLDPFQTAGVTSNTAGTGIHLGAVNNTSHFNGKATCFALLTDCITVPERDALITALTTYKL